MYKKILIQLFLFSLFILLSIFFYYKYFHKESKMIEKIEPDKNQELNLISDLRYFSVDDVGNKYEIQSKFGEISSNNSDIILMTNVKATIEVTNSKPIIITSNFAKYNIKNYDTNFTKNVLVKYIDNKLNAENLDLSFQNNLMTMNNNIIYQNLNTKLFADKLEIDLITKDSKIIMNDQKNKIKIIVKK